MHGRVQILDTCSPKTNLWLKYVDDSFVIWSHCTETLDGFLERLNSREEYIMFTMKPEKDVVILFLDILVQIES